MSCRGGGTRILDLHIPLDVSQVRSDQQRLELSLGETRLVTQRRRVVGMTVRAVHDVPKGTRRRKRLQ